MFQIAQRNASHGPSAAMIPSGDDSIRVFGAPVSSTRYSLAVSSVLAVVSVVLLSLNYY